MRVAKPLTALAVTLTALAMIAASAVSAQAVPYDPLRITVKAGDGGVGALRGRVLTAYKLADYVDGSFVSIDDRLLDGVAVETLPTLKTHAERVLAKTTGVSDVKTLPGWGEVADPTGWLGGFRQNAGSSQNQGEFGLGWNDSGPQGIGTNSPTRAYVGTVREFADNLVKDAAALSALKAGPKSAPVTWSSGNSLNLTVPSTGVYVVLDSAPKSTWQGSNSQGTTSNPADESSVTYSTGSSLPMIVPTKADDNDLASLNESPSDGSRLTPTGELGVIVLKNVWDEEVLPENADCAPANPDDATDPRTGESNTGGQYPNCAAQPKFLDTSTNPGKDAADHASDLGDVIPYVVNYRVPDLSSYRAAYDNADSWIYRYRVVDDTTAGLRILDPDGDGTLQVTVGGTWNKSTGSIANSPQAPQTVALTRVSTLPGTGTATSAGQDSEPDAWYYLSRDNTTDKTTLVIGIGRWLVKHYGDIRANDKTTTLYGQQILIRYKARVTSAAVRNGNTVQNANRLEYSNRPDLVASGDFATTPTVTVKQWTYDIDLVKRSRGNDEGLEGAEFTLEARGDNDKDGNPDNELLSWVMVDGRLGDYRLALPGETGDTTVLTGEDGLLRFLGLDLGVYKLTETRTPGQNDPSAVNDTPNDAAAGNLDTPNQAPIDWSPDTHYGDEDPGHYQKLKSPEDITLTASFLDDLTNYKTPDYQTAARMTITKNNKAIAVGPVEIYPLFNFRQTAPPAGLSISATSALWSGQDGSGAYYANDRTSWPQADLTLWNQPVNTGLPQTGAAIGGTLAAAVALTAAGCVLLQRKRRLAAGI